MRQTVKAVAIKEWCETNLTALAWKRVVLRSLPTLMDHNLEIDVIQEPSDDLLLTGEVLETFLESIADIYDVSIPETLIEK